MVGRLLATLLALALLTALASACGGSSRASQGKKLYNAYSSAQRQRDAAESRLRQAFADISAAAAKEDRDAVIAAARRGQDAAAEVDRLLAAELEAASGLAGIPAVAADGRRLGSGLQLSRDSLALISKELEIALADPFLASRAKEVNDLAKQAADLSVKGELAVRHADGAIALALGLKPPLDTIVTTPGTTTS